ncbi:hypothetical protein TNCV_3047761 [Trichonephila clavipes]|nr:hypothetical protein TNCV_3047761 [Trichonephila clavipes]
MTTDERFTRSQKTRQFNEYRDVQRHKYPVFRMWVPSRVHCSHQFNGTSERSTLPATWRVDQPAVFIPMIRLSQTRLTVKMFFSTFTWHVSAYQSLPTIGG